jgi:hypothetical protein
MTADMFVQSRETATHTRDLLARRDHRLHPDRRRRLMGPQLPLHPRPRPSRDNAQQCENTMVRLANRHGADLTAHAAWVTAL